MFDWNSFLGVFMKNISIGPLAATFVLRKLLSNLDVTQCFTTLSMFQISSTKKPSFSLLGYLKKEIKPISETSCDFCIWKITGNAQNKNNCTRNPKR